MFQLRSFDCASYSCIWDLQSSTLTISELCSGRVVSLTHSWTLMAVHVLSWLSFSSFNHASVKTHLVSTLFRSTNHLFEHCYRFFPLAPVLFLQGHPLRKTCFQLTFFYYLWDNWQLKTDLCSIYKDLASTKENRAVNSLAVPVPVCYFIHVICIFKRLFSHETKQGKQYIL